MSTIGLARPRQTARKRHSNTLIEQDLASDAKTVIDANFTLMVKLALRSRHKASRSELPRVVAWMLHSRTNWMGYWEDFQKVFAEVKPTTQEIVEILKSPAITGEIRRVFLNFPECRYGRRLGNHWTFVEYAEAEKLGFDFTSRVKRPAPQAILQNIRELLDEEAAKP